MQHKHLANKNIVVTGATGGLGRIAAKACAAQGATVILLDKTIPDLEALYDDIVAADGNQPAIYPIDLASAGESDYLEMAVILEDEFATLHGLLHNAASFATLGPVASIAASDWIRVMNVNLNAPYILTRALLPLMQKSADASVVFTSDSSAREGKAYWGAYGVSKIAIEGLAKILASENESAKKVRINVLVPGQVDSPLRKRAFPAEPADRLAPARSLEELYIYLFSGASRGKNGQTFIADEFKV